MDENVRRVISLGFVITLLLVGAYLTAQSARGVSLLRPSNPLPPEASVFLVTPGQKVTLVVVIVVVGVVTLGIGAALAIGMRLLDKSCRHVQRDRQEV
jgi:hypothetical protein